VAEGPNILFLFSDQHAWKIAGCYGDPVAETPNLDRLAAEGVTFDNVYCPSPLCVPSRMSMLSGRWPHEQRCWTLEDPLGSDVPTWPHALGAIGRRSVLIGRLHAIGPDQRHGYAERHIGDCGPNWLGVKRQDLGVLAGAQGPARVSLERSGPGQSGYQAVDRATTGAACRWLRERARAEAPFSLTVGFLLPHCPFVAWPADYARFEGRVGRPAIPRPRDEHPWHAWWRRVAGIEDIDDDAVIRARTAYYGLVYRLDSMIGEILAALEETGLARDTLVVYASDHGEQLGERGLFWKNGFFEEAAKVPCVMRWPEGLPAGERRSQVVNLVDVAATFIDAAGAPPLPRSHGRSLLPLARDATTPWLNETFSEYVTDVVPHWTGPEATQQRMIRSGRWKLVYIHGGRAMLFDLDDDPEERNDLGADPLYEGVRRGLIEKVLAGWDPDLIAREVAERRREKDLLAAWGRRIQPESTHVHEITAADSWLEEEEKA